jgi:hypothetical protein
MLSSLPRFVQPMRDGRLDTRSWTGECSHQYINEDWDIVTRFCNILHECNVVISKLKSSKIRVPLYKSAELTRKTKQFEASRDDIDGEYWHPGRVSRDLLAFNVTLILAANDVWYFRSVTLLSRELSHRAGITLSFNII